MRGIKQVLVISAPQQSRRLNHLTETKHDIEFVYQEGNSFETSTALYPEYDLILYYAGIQTDIDTLVDKADFHKISIPVIVSLDHPTIDQTVDLMNAGAAGVVNWTDMKRLSDLLDRNLDGASFQLSNTIYKDIIDAQSELICRYDADLKLKYVNLAYCDWQGQSAEQLMGMSIAEKIPTEEREKAIAHVRALTQQNPVAVSSHSSIMPDGSKQTIEWTDRAIFDGQGRLVEYLGVGRDISKLRMSEEKFATMFRVNTSIMGLSDIETGEYVEVNDAFCDILGFTREEVIGTKSTELIKLDPAWRMKTLQNLQAQGYVHNEETVILAKDGSPVPVMLCAEVITLHGKQYNFTTAVDITDLKRAEDALRSSEEQLKSLIDSQTNYLVRIDLEGRYTYWNPKFEQDFGWIYSSKGILGRNSLETIAPYHHHRTTETVKKCLLSPGVPIRIELDKPARDGGYITVLWEFICLTDAKNAPIGIQCIGIDISEQKKSQMTVQRQSDLLQQVTDAIVTFDTDQRITSWNKAATDIYGWTEDEAIGHVMEELVQAEWLTDSKAFALATFESTDKWQGELREKDKSGRELYIITSVNRLYNEYGEPVGGVLINRDITSKKKAEEVIHLQNEVLHQSQDLIAMADPSGVITYMNQGGATLLGAKSPDELIGKLLTSTHPPAEAERTIKEYVPHALEKGYWRGENRIKTLDGRVLDVDQTIFLIRDKDGKFISAASIIVDITERVETQKAIKQTQKQLQDILDNTPAHVFVKDLQGRHLMVNQGWRDYTGMDDDTQVIGKTPYEIYPHVTHPDERFSANEQVVLESGQTMFFEEHSERTGITVLSSKFLLRDSTSEVYAICNSSVDITEMKRAEDKIRRSEKRYRQMFELVSLPKLITDPKTAQILDANPAAVDFYGYPLETLKTMTMMQINVADSKEILETMAKVLAGDLDKCDFNQRLADGSIREVEGYAVAIDYQEQDALYCTYVDVTERNRAQAALEDVNQLLEHQIAERTQDLEKSLKHLEEERNLLRTIIDAVPHRLYVKNKEHEVILNNSSHADFMGQLITNASQPVKLPDNVSAERQEKVKATEAHIIATGESLIDTEDCIVQPDGEQRWVSTSKVPLRNLDDEIIGIVGITTDITHLKENEEALRKSEQALRESEHMLQLILDTVPVRIFWKDTNLIYRGCNRQYANDAGLADNRAVIGMTDMDFAQADAEDIEAYRADDRAVIESGIPKLNIEETVTPADGTPLYVRTSKVPLRNTSNQIIGVLGIYIDITQQKQVQDQLQYLARLQEFMQDAVIGTDLEFNVRSWNKAAETMYGLSAQEVIGKWLPSVLTTEFIGTTHETMRAKVYDDGLWQGEAIQYHQNGTPINVLSSIVLVRDEKGKPIGIMGVNNDFTERKRIEEALLSSEERLRTIVENIPVMISSFDTEGRFEFVNKHWIDQVGWTVEDLRSAEDPLALFYPDINYRQQVLEFMLSEEKGWRDFKGQTKHRGERITSWANVRLSDGRSIGIGQDITDRKQAEDDLKSVMQRLQLAAEAGGIGIWDWRTETNEMLWDDQMYHLYGVSDHHFTGTVEGWETALHSDDAARAQSEVEAALRGEKRFDTEFRIVTPKGDIRYLRAHANVYTDADGKPNRMIGVNMDITDLKHAQRVLEQTLEKEKELSKMKSSFLSTASHQFRTPLAAILATTETLTKLRDRMNEEQIDTRLDRIRSQVNRMKGLMEDVLELSRMQSKQIQYKPLQTNIDALCREVVSDFTEQVEFKDRIVYAEQKSSLVAYLDPHLMHHVVSNLIHNALKYSEGVVHVDLALVDHEIIFKVTDDGIGIPEDDLKNLFIPFVRAENVGMIEGTGLGLSIVEQSVKAHSGTIDVESKVGTGTTFIVKIPYRQEDGNNGQNTSD